MKKFVAVLVVFAGCLFVQPVATEGCVPVAPVRRTVCFFRTNKPVRKALKAVVTFPVKRVRQVRAARCH